jgi:hypothetical protein
MTRATTMATAVMMEVTTSLVISIQARTGVARRRFSAPFSRLVTTAYTRLVSAYAPSSGALYPALKRLEQTGVLRSRLTPASGHRMQRIYHATVAGIAAHVAWVQQPVDPETVAQDLGLHLMRFVFLGGLLSRDEVLVFLGSLADALEKLVAEIESYTAAMAASAGDAGYPVLALEHGIAVYRASLGWARHTRRELARREA